MAIGILPIIIIFAAIIAGVIIFISYRVKINKALNNEESTAHISIPDPSSSFRSIISVVIIILLIVILINQNSKITDLESQINDLQNNISCEAALQTSRIEEIIRTSNSKIIGLSYQLENYDAASDTCTISYTVNLKEYSPSTSVTLVMPYGGEIPTTPMSDGRFQGICKCSLYENNTYPVAKVIISDDTKASQELLEYCTDEIDYPIEPPICEFYRTKLNLSEDAMNHFSLNGYDYTQSDLYFCSTWYDQDPVTAARLYLTVNGTEEHSMDVTDSLKNSSSATISLKDSGMNGKWGNGDFVELYLELDTASGLTITNLLADAHRISDHKFGGSDYLGESYSIKKGNETVFSSLKTN